LSDYIAAIVLGVIEGLTEFLPVSSTGHMILAKPLLGIDDGQPLWRVFLFVSQLGAILAVVTYFGRDLWRRTFAPAPALREHLYVKLFVAFVPSVALGLLLNDYMEAYLEEGPFAPYAVGGALILGAGAIEWIDRRYRRAGPQTLDDVTFRQALLIGLCQCVSMWPGVSRAGATIMGGMVVGLTPRVATEFSFYLAIPTMLAAGAYRTLKYRADLTSDILGVVLVGSAVAFAVALAVVAGFLQYVRTKRFTPFAVYRVLLGLAVLAWHLSK